MPLGRKTPKANKVAASRQKETEQEAQNRKEKNRLVCIILNYFILSVNLYNYFYNKVKHNIYVS